MKRALACFVLLIGMAVTGGAIATPVNWGVPVSGFGATTTVGNYNSATGQIGMYIPLTGGYHGVYGVNGVGLSASTAQAPTSGSMNMFLKFTGVSVGPNIFRGAADGGQHQHALRKLGVRADLTQLTGVWENTQEFMKASISGVATPVSEPVTLGFLGLGMLGLAALRRRTRATEPAAA